MNYLEKFSILSENQNGFRKKKDCLQAATLLWKKIQSNWKSEVKTNCILKKNFFQLTTKLYYKSYTISVSGAYPINS